MGRVKRCDVRQCTMRPNCVVLSSFTYKTDPSFVCCCKCSRFKTCKVACMDNYTTCKYAIAPSFYENAKLEELKALEEEQALRAAKKAAEKEKKKEEKRNKKVKGSANKEQIVKPQTVASLKESKEAEKKAKQKEYAKKYYERKKLERLKKS